MAQRGSSIDSQDPPVCSLGFKLSRTQ